MIYIAKNDKEIKWIMMERSLDVVALGELLIDMTMNEKSAQGNSMYEANPGGAPSNVLAMLSRLGHKTAFIGKVGDDIFGHELKEVLSGIGIESRGLIADPKVRTTLAFVKTFEDGDRDFSFYRNPGAYYLGGDGSPWKDRVGFEDEYF